MTREEIEQKAEEYILPLKTLPGADENITFIATIRIAFEAGAHSRDEEIGELKDELESMRKGFYERGDKLKKLMVANNKFRNPWRDAKKDPPKDGEWCLFRFTEPSWAHGLYEARQMPNMAYSDYIRCGDIIAWMPIQELKKGE